MLYVYSVFGGFAIAAPMSHDTIKFNSNIFNNLRLLTQCTMYSKQCFFFFFFFYDKTVC